MMDRAAELDGLNGRTDQIRQSQSGKINWKSSTYQMEHHTSDLNMSNKQGHPGSQNGNYTWNRAELVAYTISLE